MKINYREMTKAPEITSHLRDAQVDEGNRFEFTAYIKGEPVPEIRWFKVNFRIDQ